jgi:hypothetical protein
MSFSRKSFRDEPFGLARRTWPHLRRLHADAILGPCPRSAETGHLATGRRGRFQRDPLPVSRLIVPFIVAIVASLEIVS